MNTDQIAAEAWREMLRTSLREVPCLKMDASGCVGIIKSAIEKAYLQGYGEGRDNAFASKKVRDLESRAAHASEQRTTPATASEIKDEDGRKLSDIQEFERLSLEHDDPTMIRSKPDSASTGKDEALQIIDEQIPHFQFALTRKNGRQVWLHDLIREIAATPSGGGEWTVIEAETKGEDHQGRPIPLYHIWTGKETLPLYERDKQAVQEVADARNAALRDCGNDTKRLDLMEKQGSQFAKIKGKSWRESADIHAAMLETGEQTKEKE